MRRAPRSPHLTPKSRKQTKNSTMRVWQSALWPRFKPNVLERSQHWARPNWTYLIREFMLHSMDKLLGSTSRKELTLTPAWRFFRFLILEPGTSWQTFANGNYRIYGPA